MTHIAAALCDNDKGRLISAEQEATKIARAVAHLEEAGLSAWVEAHHREGLCIIPMNVPYFPIFDCVSDGAKELT